MKSLASAAILLAVLVASVVFLRSIDPGTGGLPLEPRRGPVAETPGVAPSQIDPEQFAGQSGELGEMAEEMLSLWHVREAAELFETALRDSASVAVYVGLMECYAHPLMSREDDLRRIWREARENAYTPEDTLLLRGLKALYAHGDYETAAEALGGVSGDEALYHKGRALLAMGNPGAGRDAAGRLLRRDESDGRAASLYIRCASAMGDLAEASRVAKSLARSYAEEPFPYVLLAQAELADGRAESAAGFCNNALAIDPRYVPAILTRAIIYAEAGEFDAARVSYEKLLLFDDPVLQSTGMEGVAFVEFLSGAFDDGIDAMDEAVRLAILAGAVRMGLSCAVRLVGYLCELGQRDAAEAVVERWVTGFGDVPVHIGKLRVYILDGEFDAAQAMLTRIHKDPAWRTWGRMLGVDAVALRAWAQIGSGKAGVALDLLNERESSGRQPWLREFLRGTAAFEAGDAETARGAFSLVRADGITGEFPVHADPVLFVQSLYFGAEAALAAGDRERALPLYRRFLDFWGETKWSIGALDRARSRIESAEPAPAN